MGNPLVRSVVGATISSVCDFLELRIKLIEKAKSETSDTAVLNQLHGRVDEISEIATFLNMMLDATDRVCKSKSKNKPKIDMPVGDQNA